MQTTNGLFQNYLHEIQQIARQMQPTEMDINVLASRRAVQELAARFELSHRTVAEDIIAMRIIFAGQFYKEVK